MLVHRGQQAAFASDRLRLAGGSRIARVVQRHFLTALARQCNADGVVLETRCREHMRAIDSHALRFVDRGGIAMIGLAIIFEVKKRSRACRRVSLPCVPG